jgi:hypothetical protein
LLKLRRLTGLWKAVSILERYCLCHESCGKYSIDVHDTTYFWIIWACTFVCSDFSLK